MSREYVIPVNAVTLANQAVTLAYFQVMSSTPMTAIEVLRAYVSQRGSTTSAQVGVQLNTQVSAFPTLTSQAPVKAIILLLSQCVHNLGEAPPARLYGTIVTALPVFRK